MIDVPVAALAAAVALWLAVALARRGAARGRDGRVLVSRTVALALVAAAAVALAVGAAGGWTGTTVRAVHLLSGVLAVPWLALGTVQAVLADRAVLRLLGVAATVVALVLAVAAVVATPALLVPGVLFAALWALLLLTATGDAVNAGATVLIGTFTAVAAFAVLAAEVTGPLPAAGLPDPGDLFAPGVRSFALAGNAVGVVLVVVGSLASALRARRRATPDVAGGDLLIAVGVVAVASVATSAVPGGVPGHALAFLAGAVLVYAGSVRAGRPTSDLDDPVELVIYTRHPCGLCTRAEELVGLEAPDVAVERRDIDADPELQARYHVRVPVIEVDGVEVAEGRIEPGQIRAAVRRARKGRRRGPEPVRGGS